MDVRSIIDARLDGLPSEKAEVLLSALREEALARCANDGHFWLQFVKTRDEADPDQSVKPFPIYLDYVREVWSVLTNKQLVVLAKSRQMLATWIACAFCVWWARFKPHQAVYWQTQTWPDATDKVAGPKGGKIGRMQFIELNLPSWLKQDVAATEGQLVYPNGSSISALAGGADKIRGNVGSIIVEDEFAYQAEARGVYVAVAPLIQKGAKFIAISTPNGMNSIFADIYHGIARKQE